MPSKGCEIIISSEGLVHFLRKMDRSVLDQTLKLHASGSPLPDYENQLFFFKEAVRDAFRIDRGLVLLADENRLVRELAVFGHELQTLFANASLACAQTVTALFLEHILQCKFDQNPDEARLRDALSSAASTNRVYELENVIANCLAGSPFPRQSQWRLSRLLRR